MNVLTAQELRDLALSRIARDAETHGGRDQPAVIKKAIVHATLESVQQEEAQARTVRETEGPELAAEQERVVKLLAAFRKQDDAITKKRAEFAAKLVPDQAALSNAYVEYRSADHAFTRRRMDVYARAVPVTLWRALQDYWRELEESLRDEYRLTGDWTTRAGIGAAINKLREPTGGKNFGPDGDQLPPEDLCAWFAAHLKDVADAREQATAEATREQAKREVSQKHAPLFR